MRVRSPDVGGCAQYGLCPPSVPADLRRAYVALPRSRFGHVAVGSVDWAWAGPTGRLTPRNNRPDYRGSRPLANAASGS